MRGLRNVINQYRYIASNNQMVVAFFILGLLAFGVLGISQYTGVHAEIVRNCDDNAVMNCGAADANEFRSKYDQNAPGDLPAIYGHYWIPRDLQVVQGQSFKDNTVRVNGRVVATNAQSIGRQAINGSHAISIAGKTYFETPNSAAFRSDGLPTLVALDAQGNFKYAVIEACGNPIYATPTPPTPPPTPPTPHYSCDSLSIQNTGELSKRFVVTASASGGAQITGYNFNFGDNSSQDTTYTAIDHTYNQAGTYTVIATAKVSVNGNNVTASGPNCTKTFTIKAPAAVSCTSLVATARGNNSYDFTINKTNVNATYQGASINYGDGSSDQITDTTASHTYAKIGNYMIVATLSFNIDGAVKSATCQTQVTGSPCVYNNNVPTGSPECQPPVTPPTPPTPSLPVTGASDMLFGGVGVGSMILSASFYLGSRRDFLMTLLGQAR